MKTKNRFKIVFFDSGGVLVFGNPWEKLAQAVQMPLELDRKWINDYYDGKISFEQWNQNVESFYRKAGLNKKLFEEVLDLKNFTFNQEAEVLVKKIKELGYETAIISSDSEYFIEKIADHYGIVNHKSNCKFIFNEAGIFEEIKYVSSDPNAKVIQIEEVCKEYGTKPTDCIFIGDSFNDYEAFELTKHGILYGNHPKLAKYAWMRVSDLREVIEILEDAKSN